MKIKFSFKSFCVVTSISPILLKTCLKNLCIFLCLCALIEFYVAFKFIIPATAFCDVLLNFGASQPRILSIVCSIHSITMGYYFIFTIFLRICVIGWSRNENSGDFALFKNHLDIFLSTVPDQPTIPGLSRAAATNSLLDQVPLLNTE